MTMPTTPTQPIDTFTLRPAKHDDLAEAVALFNTCSRELFGNDEVSLADLEIEWSSPDMNLETNTRIVQTASGALVGYIEIWNSAPHVDSWIWGRVHPEYLGQGIGTALMDWAEARAQAMVDRAPDGARVSMGAGSFSTHQPTIELLSDRGYHELRRYYTMAIDFDAPPAVPAWPAGIIVRPMRPGEERAVFAARNEAFKDHFGHVEAPFEAEFAEWRHRTLNDPNFDMSLWFLGLDGDEIAGVALCWPVRTDYPGMGWVGTLGVRRPWRRRGLAQALLLHSFGELYRRGRRQVGLGVDASSLTGATRVYERVGMRPIRQFVTFERELRPGKELGTQAIED
jgi:ribosomal protein S18 acetylase RimI-like enzyme